MCIELLLNQFIQIKTIRKRERIFHRGWPMGFASAKLQRLYTLWLQSELHTET